MYHLFLTVSTIVISVGFAVQSTSGLPDFRTTTTNQSEYILTSIPHNPLGEPLTRNACTSESSVDMKFRNESEKDACCREIVNSFSSIWTGIVYRITDYLRILKMLRCPQFHRECEHRSYDFTEFTGLTYDRFCDAQSYDQKCGAAINETMQKHVTHISAEPEIISQAVRNNTSVFRLDSLRNLTLDMEDLLKPCVQAGLIDTERCVEGTFYEMKEFQAPFCGLIWCGFPGYAFESHEISEWTCMPKTCRINVYILMVVCGILAFVSVAVNFLSLVIFSKNQRLRDSQGIFKFSLALADLLIGLIVLPLGIETIRRTYMPATDLFRPEEHGSFYLQYYSFSYSYHNFAGFFTTLTNLVAILTLVIASLDRFMVVFRPLRYNVYTAKSWAVKLSIGVWVVCVLLSIMPIIHPNMRYALIAGFLESIMGAGEIIILAIYFVIPLVFVVLIHVATILYSRRNARARPKAISNRNKTKEINIENRLAKTLGIMVTAFLLCLLPLGVVIIAHAFLPDINPRRPNLLNPEKLVMMSSLEHIFCVGFLSNSVWNFVIYNARSAEFRAAAKRYYNGLEIKLFSKLKYSTAEERRRKASAALSSSQVPCNTASTALNI